MPSTTTNGAGPLVMCFVINRWHTLEYCLALTCTHLVGIYVSSIVQLDFYAFCMLINGTGGGVSSWPYVQQLVAAHFASYDGSEF